MFWKLVNVVFVLTLFNSCATATDPFWFKNERWRGMGDYGNQTRKYEIKISPNAVDDWVVRIEGLFNNTDGTPQNDYCFHSSGDSMVWVTDPGQPNEALHLRLARLRNRYWTDPYNINTDQSRAPIIQANRLKRDSLFSIDTMFLHHTNLDWRRYGTPGMWPYNTDFYRDATYGLARSDSLDTVNANLCAGMIWWMNGDSGTRSHDSIWYSTRIYSDNVNHHYYYGKFQWKMANSLYGLDYQFHPGFWIYDGTNQSNAFNEIDFEFSRFYQADSGGLSCNVNPGQGTDRRQPFWILDTNDTISWVTYSERKHSIIPPSDGATYEFVYQPDSVKFHVYGGAYNQQFTFPYWPGAEGMMRTNWGPVGNINQFVVPPCGNDTRIMMSNEIWAYFEHPTSTGITGHENSIEMVITSFKYKCLYSPNGGEHFESGDSIRVTWEDHALVRDSMCVWIGLFHPDLFSYSNWFTVANNGYHAFKLPSNWFIPYPAEHSNIKIQFQASDLRDSSDAYFTYGTIPIGSVYLPTTPVTYGLITGPVSVEPGDTAIFSANAHLTFADSGKIIVPSGSTLIFEGDSKYNHTIVDCPLKDSPAEWSHIEVQSGGTLIGNNVTFSNLGCAIECAGGSVQLDSTEFDSCAIGLNMSTTSELVEIAHSAFNNDSLAIYLTDATNGIAVSNCNFTNNLISIKAEYIASTPATIDNCTINQPDISTTENVAIWVQNSNQVSFKYDTVTCHGIASSIRLISCDTLLIDNCTITGDTTYTSGLYLEQCTPNTHIDNSFIRHFQVGATLSYSSARFYNDEISDNAFCGFLWSQDYSYSYPLGRIDQCQIFGNGWYYSNGAGFNGYSCYPIFTCNTFYNNYDNAVHVSGSCSPCFYDVENQVAGVNAMTATNGEPIVLIDDDATPLFALGHNDLEIASGNDLYMRDQSSSPLLHNVKQNYFNQGFYIANFDPPDANVWKCQSQSSPTQCETQMASIGGGATEMLMRGDSLLYAHDTTQAIYAYTSAVTLSGDTTEAGPAGLNRLSLLTDQFPTVGSRLQKARLYASSYHYDRVRNFTASDSRRDSILMVGNHRDSVRVRYDHALSMLLRPHTMSTGVRAEREHERIMANIRELSDELFGFRRIPRQVTSNIILPKEYKLYSAYPNPFNSITHIRFDLPKTDHVKITVYNALGRQVTTLVNETLIAGQHEVQWNGSAASTGVYFVTMHSSTFTATKKIVLLK